MNLTETSSSLLIGTSLGNVHVINEHSLVESFKLDHQLESITATNTNDLVNIYKESESRDGIFYDALQRPYKLPVAASQRKAIELIAKSFDGRFAAIKACS